MFAVRRQDGVGSQIGVMRKLIILLVPLYLLALSPFESPKRNSFDLSVFNTKKSIENVKAINNQKVKCRYVCDKKIYKEQKIADAISFYKRGLTP